MCASRSATQGLLKPDAQVSKFNNCFTKDILKLGLGGLKTVCGLKNAVTT